MASCTFIKVICLSQIERKGCHPDKRLAQTFGHGGDRCGDRAGGLGLGFTAHQRLQRIPDAHTGSCFHRCFGMAIVRRDLGQEGHLANGNAYRWSY